MKSRPKKRTQSLRSFRGSQASCQATVGFPDESIFHPRPSTQGTQAARVSSSTGSSCMSSCCSSESSQSILKLLKHRETNSAVARLCRRTGTSPRRKRHSNVAPASKCQTEWPRAFGAVATTPDHCTAQQPEQSNAMQFAPCDPPKSGEGLASLEVPPNGSDQSNEPEVRQLRLGLL